MKPVLCRVLICVSIVGCSRSEMSNAGGDGTGPRVDIAAQLTASPRPVVIDGIDTFVSVIALSIVDPPPPALTIGVTGALVSLDGSAPAASINVPFVNGFVVTVAVSVEPPLGAGAIATMSISAPGYNVHVSGDAVLALQSRLPNGNVITLGSQDVEVAAGWQVDVFRDISAEHVYVEDDFLETSGFNSNPVTAITAIDLPFPPGLAISAGRSILVIEAGGAYSERDYRPPINNDTGPDRLNELGFFYNWPPTGAAALFVGASSQNGGDGVYRIDPDWSINRVVNVNNVHNMLPDPTGAFEGTGNATLYYTTQGALTAFPGNGTFIGLDFYRCAFTVGNAVACGRPDEFLVEDISVLEPISFNQQVLPAGLRTNIRPVGPPYSPGRQLLAIADSNELVDIHTDGTETLLVRSVTPGWSWIDLTKPPPGHPLAVTPNTYYLLEREGNLDIERVLRLTGP